MNAHNAIQVALHALMEIIKAVYLVIRLFIIFICTNV